MHHKSRFIHKTGCRNNSVRVLCFVYDNHCIRVKFGDVLNLAICL